MIVLITSKTVEDLVSHLNKEGYDIDEVKWESLRVFDEKVLVFAEGFV